MSGPRTAAAAQARALAGTQDRDRALRPVAERWAAQLPEGSNVRGHAYGQVLADWVEGDPFRASEWLKNSRKVNPSMPP